MPALTRVPTERRGLPADGSGLAWQTATPESRLLRLSMAVRGLVPGTPSGDQFEHGDVGGAAHPEPHQLSHQHVPHQVEAAPGVLSLLKAGMQELIKQAEIPQQHHGHARVVDRSREKRQYQLRASREK